MAERRAGGRPPSLRPRARTWLVLGGIAIGLGLVTGQVDGVRVGLGLWLVLFGLYVDSLRLAIVVWRRQLGVRWEVDPKAVAHGVPVGEAIASRIVVGNRSPVGLTGCVLRPVVGGTLLPVDTLRGDAPAEDELHFAVPLVARTFGAAHVHGVFLTLADRFGLFSIEAYFPLPQRVRVRLPSAATTGHMPLRLAERVTQTALPDRRRARRGEEVPEIQKLRDWQPGDPFRRIAWHKTARTGRLLVRELDRAPAGDLVVLVDLGPSMRLGAPGDRPIDRAMQKALRLCRQALSDGYRVGLCLFDLEVLGEVPLGRGPKTRGGIELLIEQWAELGGVADRGMSDSELGSVVARYLQVQHGVDLRTQAPPLDDPRWARLLVTNAGELYDLDDLTRATGAPPREGATTQAPQERLIRFAHARGIELPWRAPGHATQAARFTRTLVKILDDLPKRAAAVLVTDGEELHLPSLRGVAGRLARRGAAVRLELVGPSLAGMAGTPLRLLGLQQRELRRRAAVLQRRLRATGLRLSAAGASGRATSHIDARRIVQ